MHYSIYLLFLWSMIKLVNSFPQQRFLFQNILSKSYCGPSSNSFRNSFGMHRTNHKSTHEVDFRRFSRSQTPIKVMNLELEAQTIEDMEDIGAVLGISSQKGDVILLDGDLGAGKTCFSRGFVRAKTGYMDLRVTSPTYLLSNTYPVNDDEGSVIHHMDLYRLSEGEDLSPLNLDYVLKECISVIEWPSRLGTEIPSERLEITIRIDKDSTLEIDNDEKEESTRILHLTAHGAKWEERLEMIQENGYLDDLIVEYEIDES